MTLNRRTALGLAAAAMTPVSQTVAPADPTGTIRLWPGAAPGGERVSATPRVVERSTDPAFRDRFAQYTVDPILTVLRPARPNGASLLLIPGGGYRWAVVDKEGLDCARVFAAAGVTCFVLRYRLPGDGWAAGADATYAAVDAADAVSFRPDLSILLYPVATMADPFVHAGSRRELLGEAPTAEAIDRYSLERMDWRGAPATFLLHAMDDAAVPVENSLGLLTALRTAGVAAEAHLFEEGGHGFGIRLIEGRPAAAWPQLTLAWAARKGWL